MLKEKTNLLFYKGKIRTLGAIWRGIWNIEGTGMPKLFFLWQKVLCTFGKHKYVEQYNGDCRQPGPIYCEYCGKEY